MRQEKSDPPRSPLSPAQRIRDARERRGLTQAGLASRLGVTRPMIAQWETGARQPWISTLKRLADALEVSYEWLAFGEEGPLPGEGPKLDPKLLSLVQSVVTDAFEARHQKVGSPFFFQVVVIVYTVAHHLQAKRGLTSSELRQALCESALHAISA